jgi:hypothetical protein
VLACCSACFSGLAARDAAEADVPVELVRFADDDDDFAAAALPASEAARALELEAPRLDAASVEEARLGGMVSRRGWMGGGGGGAEQGSMHGPMRR